jgi:hypothetical protein
LKTNKIFIKKKPRKKLEIKRIKIVTKTSKIKRTNEYFFWVEEEK